MERALTLDPLSTVILQTSAMLYLDQDLSIAERRLDRSWRQLGLKGPTGWEGYWVRHLLRGDFDQARAWLANHPLKVNTQPYGLIIDAIEEPSKSEAVAGVLLQAWKGGFPSWTTYHGLHLIGQPEHALTVLEEESADGFFPIGHVLFIGWAEQSHGDPRFWRAMQDMNYIDYWRAAGWPDFCRSFRAPDTCETLADGVSRVASENPDT